MISPKHEQLISHLFTRACIILKHPELKFRPMQGRTGGVKSTRNLTLGHTNLKNKTIFIDIYTPRHRKPKSINSILRVIAHEIAHHQKLPYRQRYKGRLIVRKHYPVFYRQINRNVEKFKRDCILGKYFKTPISDSDQ